MFLSHLGIGPRLGLVFGLVIAVFLAMATVAWLLVDSMNGEIGAIVDRRYPSTRLANELKAAAGDASRSMANILVMTDEFQIQQELALIDVQVRTQAAVLATLRRTAAEPGEAAELREITAMRDAFVPAQAGFRRLVAQGRKSDAAAEYLLSVRKAQAPYLTALTGFVHLKDEQMQRAGKASAAEARQAGLMILGLALAATVASAWAGLRVVRSIAPPRPRAAPRVGQAAEPT